MRRTLSEAARGLAAILFLAASPAAIAVAQETVAGAAVAAPTLPADWVDKGGDWPARKSELQAFGEGFANSLALYDRLKKTAGGGSSPSWSDMGQPAYDWAGVWTRSAGGLSFDPDIKADDGPTTAKLTPEGQAAVDAKRRQMETTGGEYDPISDCRPPGTPRWLTEPFLHEYSVSPHQTWLMNEMVNDVRRVYTDGRDHTPEADAYPTWNGDTIGFWSGGILTTHTQYLNPGQYQRGIQPNYSDQVTLVERWKKVDDKTLQADVWVFDPVNLAQPWYTRQSWTKLTNDDFSLRVRYWDCGENANNQIVVREDGTSQFPDFDFVGDDAKASNDPAVAKAAADKAAAERAAAGAGQTAAPNAPTEGGNAQ